MSDHLAIEATGLTKAYGETQVLGGVDLRVAPGSVFSLLGPNGAGKTTMVRILSTLLRADGGRARVAGFDIAAQRHQVRRRRISLTGQYAALDGHADRRGEPAHDGPAVRPDAERRPGGGPANCSPGSGLEDAAGRRVATYSGGMRRRLDLAASLVGHPGGDLPRRADDRPGPAQPANHVAGHRRAGRLAG